MTWVVRVVRTCGVEQVQKDLALVAVPAPGARVDLRAHGGGLQRVDEVIFLPQGAAVGWQPPGVTLLLAPEPPEALEAAQAGGWHPVTIAGLVPAA